MINDIILTSSKNKHYAQKYFNFIKKYAIDEVEGYTETHHILPKSLFPEYDKEGWNLVQLTARQHFIAHVLLAKAFGGRMWHAVNMMTHCDENGKRNYRVSSRIYEIMKVERAKQLSVEMTGENNPMYGTSRKGKDNPMYGKTHSDEAKLKQSEKSKAYYSNPENLRFGEKNGMFGKTYTHSEESKALISIANKGKLVSDETKEKQRIAKLGKSMPDGFGEKLSIALSGVKKSNQGKKNMSEARSDTRRVYNRDGKFRYIKLENLHLYFLRDGKYYDYKV